MVDHENTTKVQETENEATEADSEGTLSLESLDEIIANEDPEFAKALESIGPDDPQNVIYEDGIELLYTLEEEVKLWKASPGIRAKLVKVLPFLPRISYKFKMQRTIMRLSWLKFKEQAIYRVKNAKPLLLGWIKGRVTATREGLSSGMQTFKEFSLLKKLAFVGLIVLTIGSGYLLHRMSTRGLFEPEQEMFVGSLSDWAKEKYIYDPKTQVESFYESTRTSQNILLLKRMIANLRRSADSGPTPMGAFEFYIEGTVSEVVVEIKDREPEVGDLFLRTIEDMTFDQVASGEGKQLLCERLRKEVNKILTKGHVRRIFIKTAIVKP